MPNLINNLLTYVNANLADSKVYRLIPRAARMTAFDYPHNLNFVNTLDDLGPVGEHADAPVGLNQAVDRSVRYLLAQQHPAGYWCGELGADATLPADNIVMYYFLGRFNEDKIRRYARHILNVQCEDGSWRIYPGAPEGNISATVKCYFALKLAGYDKDDEPLVRARKWILAHGGAEKINTYSRIYLAMFGLFEWDEVPAIPPELILLPDWFYFNVYEVSSWSRAILLPLSIIWDKKPFIPIPPSADISEIFTGEKIRIVPGDGKVDAWGRFFVGVDRLLKVYEGLPVKPFRTQAIRKVEEWIAERLKTGGGLGAIYPAMVNALFALKLLGYADDHPLVEDSIREIEAFDVYYDDAIRVQPCKPPVWDTAITMIALSEAGLPENHPALVSASHWMLSQEIRMAGDYAVKNLSVRKGKVAPSGWAFEFQNVYYPDIDDTAMVIMALKRARIPEDKAREQCILRALTWELSMQSSNGGWAAFDVDNTKEIFNRVPFADHNALLDPPSADITARLLEMLGSVGYDNTYPTVKRALKYLYAEQEKDGAWYGRWGVNFVYGTWQALRGLEAIGEDMTQPRIRDAIHWLREHQNEDGGWGESCHTYDDPSTRGRGPSTPSQTAWGIMGLLHGGAIEDPAVERGIDYLLANQNSDGSWDEDWYTGTGFPKVFYLEYTMYRNYFPLMALAEYRKARRLNGTAARVLRAPVGR